MKAFRRPIMTHPVSPYMRKMLFADAFVSGAAAILMVAGAGPLGSFLELPPALLFWAGVVLFPFVALLIALATRESAPRLFLLDIVLINGLWALASIVILLAGLVTPNVLGTLFVVAQALAVALLGALQFTGLRGTWAEAV